MNPVVHILVTCRNAELFRASTLVFDTIRVGFPTAEVFVRGNNLEDDHAWEIMQLCDMRGLGFVNRGETDHAKWILEILQNEPKPFFIVDSDVFFWDSLEQFAFSGPIHGRYTPRFRCPFTGTITHDRLHTSVLYIDPTQFWNANGKAQKRINPNNPFFVGIDLVNPVNVALNGETFFHDTLGQAYHSMGGNRFSEEILNCYDHLGCGTYLDLLDEKVPGSRARQEEYLKNPRKARGLWKQQQKWERANAA